MRTEEPNTGHEYSYRLIGGDAGIHSQHYHGAYDTRHEAIGIATIVARHEDADGWDVQPFETIWRRADEPAECDYCGAEDWYRPLVSWVMALDETDMDGEPVPSGMFCTRQCHARYSYEWHQEHDEGDDDE